KTKHCGSYTWGSTGEEYYEQMGYYTQVERLCRELPSLRREVEQIRTQQEEKEALLGLLSLFSGFGG
ncbi:MAG: hypothetical protein V3R93_06830, partial [Candidatus Hydrothermarchaeaceae archaeon]